MCVLDPLPVVVIAHRVGMVTRATRGGSGLSVLVAVRALNGVCGARVARVVRVGRVARCAHVVCVVCVGRVVARRAVVGSDDRVVCGVPAVVLLVRCRCGV